MKIKILPVKLTSYGELHPGREKSEKLDKRCWYLINGSTLYGAICKYLIDFCKMPGSHSFDLCNPDKTDEATAGEECRTCANRKMLSYIKQEHFRISPLIPVKEEIDSVNGKIYCEAWNKWKDEISFYKTTHSPINRESITAQEGRIHNIERHPPGLNYIGFIVVPDDKGFIEEIIKSISFLSFNPFGGKGKFAFVEGDVFEPVDEEEFMQGLNLTNSLEIITPVVHGEKGTNSYPNLSNRKIITRYILQNSYGTDLTLMKVWRRGLYLNEKTFVYEYKDKEHGDEEVFSCIPEGGMFEVNDINVTKDFFLRGIGNSCYTYLGYGQVVYCGEN